MINQLGLGKASMQLVLRTSKQFLIKQWQIDFT